MSTLYRGVPESKTTPNDNGAPATLRRFGRFELRALLSKSARSMSWLVFDTRGGQEMILCMPRAAPVTPELLADWLKSAQAGSRIQHPNLGLVLEISQVEHWPYIAYDRALGETLAERLARQAAPLPVEVAQWLAQGLEGLAFVHEANHAHRDVQLGSLVINAAGQVSLLGLEVAQDLTPGEFSTTARRAQREAAEEDVVCFGLLLHRLLGAHAVLDQNDFQLVLQRMQPVGHEMVRLPFETPHPIAAPLRAIANRATDRQARQRYHSARAFLRALEGWRQSTIDSEGGPVKAMLDRVQRFGHLPILTTRLNHVSESNLMLATHTNEIAALVMQDMSLCLELMRRVNNALKQQGGAGEGAVLSMQRAIAMIGLEGVEQAARSLRPWPGVINETQSHTLRVLMGRVHRAGEIAQALRPAGYSAEVVYLICVMQNLGRLLVQYHMPDDAQQIRQLMQVPEPTEDVPHPVAMTEQAAAYAVMGTDVDSLGAAVARYWALGDELMHMARRQPTDAPVRMADGDADVMRLTCSLANELVEAQSTSEPRRQQAIEAVTRRYARALGIGLREIQAAMNPDAARKTDAENGNAHPPPRASALREKAAGVPSAAPLPPGDEKRH